MFPIGRKTWARLVTDGAAAVEEGWAADGVFSGAVGPDYRCGDPSSILFIGKSLGPAGPHVRINYHQATSTANSLSWMLERERRHPGHRAFWKLVDRFDRSRRSLAWTNVCKIEPSSAETPGKWQRREVAGPCRAALAEELAYLKPRIALFVTGHSFEDEVVAVLSGLSYSPAPKVRTSEEFQCFRHSAGRYAVLTRHPTFAAAEWFEEAVDICRRLKAR